MHPRLIRPRGDFERGFTPITQAGAAVDDTGIDFGILRLEAGQRYTGDATQEEALLLLHGTVTFHYDGAEARVTRSSLFDQEPTALHLAAGHVTLVTAHEDAEIAVARAANDRDFPTRLFDATSLLESEHRDRGRLDDTSYRVVRTIFDGRNRPEAALVLGEVLTFPGRWSSYPPHHHPQPELYHYRFTDPRGYGHAELGEEVIKVRPRDTIVILDEHDHAQVAAPGYGMYYTWVIRHLPDQPYTVPSFHPDHEWLRAPTPDVWRPPT